jgi:DNA polymerase-3 subunit delta
MAKQTSGATFLGVMRELEMKHYSPVYTLCGDEPYFNDKICDKIEAEVLNEAEKGFNQSVYYGKDIDTQSIVSAAKRYPMMAERQVVIIKEAQYLKNMDALNPYLEKPLQSTVLVLLFRGNGQLKKTNTYKLLSKYTVHESSKIPDYKLSEWIDGYLLTKGFKTDAAGLHLIAESCGNDLNTIENELTKIFLNIGDRKSISLADIEKYIGISKEYSVFELQNAISRNDIHKMAKIMDYFASDTKNNAIIMVVSSLSTFFTKVYMAAGHLAKSDNELASIIGVAPFFVKDFRNTLKHYSSAKVEQILHALNTLDLRSKGIMTNTGDENLYKELLICLLEKS